MTLGLEEPHYDAVEELKELKERMEDSDDVGDDLFFFPEHRGVRGYLGSGRVWFVGPKPSKEGPGFPDASVELLYGTLKKYGFYNAHITDFSKERGTVPEQGIPKEEVERMRPYFQREVEILQPELFLAMGRKIERALKYMAVTDEREIRYVPHYSWRVPDDDFIDAVESQADVLNLDY